MSDARQTVLLVGDEDLVRASAADPLDDAGFRVVEAANADEVRRVLDLRQASFRGLTLVHDETRRRMRERSSAA